MDQRQHFIPYRKSDLIEMCLQEERNSRDADTVSTELEEREFRRLCYMLQSALHHEFHLKLEDLKNVYASINPDADTRSVQLESVASDSKENLTTMLDAVLVKANYQVIKPSDLEQSLHEESLFKIRLQVDFDDFEEVLLYSRGRSTKTETVRTWFGLRKKQITFTNYERVVVYLKIDQFFEPDKAALPDCKPGSTILKLFRNVPKADLEMLFPNTQVRMKTVDKLFIGVPAAISGGVVLTTKVGGTLVLIGSLIGYWLGLHGRPVHLDQAVLLGLLADLGTLFGYLWKQFSNFKNRKISFMKTLTENLYFKNLDNNAGVFHRLIDDAEEEECKEAILGYFFLLNAGQPLTSKELDKIIENWFLIRWQCRLDFEIGDALEKLQRFGLVETVEGRYTCVPLTNACQRMSARWHQYQSE